MKNIIRKKGLRGSLKRYANPELMEQEQDAWKTVACEKEASFDYTQWHQELETDESIEAISSKAMRLRQNKSGTVK